jgi:hypothetical protein
LFYVQYEADYLFGMTHVTMETVPHTSISRASSGILVGLVFLFHSAIGFVLYRGRAVCHWPICDSDAFVFSAPLFLAAVAYGAVLFSSSWLRPRSGPRSFALLAICLVLVFLSTWCYMIFALNMYGS